MNNTILQLPLHQDVESKKVLKMLNEARSALAELKGVSEIIPNKNILINTLSLQEAKDSSEIESIITTHDSLYQSDYYSNLFTDIATKEVHNYAQALKIGFDSVKQTQLLTVRDIQNIQSVLVANDAGFRKQIGTQLINDTTGDIIYIPPQDYQTILNLMSNLENYLNNDAICSLDPLVKMAIIHHQFETIHPFYDGNGRTGRIINILYLVKSGLLDSPIMYLSRYINKNKSEYYRLLQSVRDTGEWEDWIMFILQAVKEIALQTIKVIGDIKNLMQEYKNLIKSKAPKIYSHELLNNIFYHPYTKLEFATKELNIQRKTAMKYLNNLVDLGILEKHKVKRENYYLNIRLFDILSNI